MKYKIVQTWYHITESPHKSLVREFKYRWTAWLYKLLHYDLTEPIFRATCDWDIVVSHAWDDTVASDDVDTVIASEASEKDQLMYYQDSMHEVCRILNDVKDFGTHNIICGTVEHPSFEIRKRLEKIISFIDYPVRVWTVEVHDDHDGFPRLYEVLAAIERDAMLMAFILDKGLEESKYGEGSRVNAGEVELARMHCEIISVRNTT